MWSSRSNNRMWLLNLVAVTCLVQVSLSFPRSNKAALTCGYDACPKTDPTKLNVHYVSHTHDDVGWLKTVDQYYFGNRANIYKVGVQYILDSVVRALQDNPARRFIYVETAFFWKWWLEQTPEKQQIVKDLVNEGRLEFIGGAWTMNDEAATIYQTTIDQFTWGLRRLNDTFGECGKPTIGWQVDPFGHSKESAALMTQYGFDGVFFGRIDYQDKEKRMADKTMEMVWQTSETLGSAADLFTGVLYNMYVNPTGYCFDSLMCNDEPMIDDPDSPDYNIDYRTFGFYAAIQTQKAKYLTNNIMLTMGGDFQYQDAHVSFKNSDKLIKYTNELYPDVNVFYSTPTCYLKSLNEAGIKWPTKNDDFFPYASGSNTYWTGYFTSRPSLKRFERLSNNILQVGKQVSSIAGIGKTAEDRLTKHREAQGIIQHHDAITGTEKQVVADDYVRLLNIAVNGTEGVISESINLLMRKSTSSPVLNFDPCRLKNISQCAVSETSSTFLVTVYNPLSRSVDSYVRLPVGQGTYSVTDSKGAILPSQIVPIPEPLKKLPGRVSTSVQELVFNAVNLPPLGYRTYYIKQSAAIANHHVRTFQKNEDITIGNEKMSLTFDGQRGTLKQVSNGREVYDMTQTLEYYIGALGTNGAESTRSSGAYIFRPTTNNSIPIGNANITVIDGPIVSETHQVFSDWASQVVRRYAGSDIIEFEWLVGPIPTQDSNGKEVVSKFRTNLNTAGRVTTDSNGRSDIIRTRNYRPTWDVKINEPVSGNYYPITTNIQIGNATDRLVVITDRAQGGGSIADGELEIMVHRRLLHDDAFGVDEMLDERAYGTGLVARGRHYVLIGKSGVAATNSIRLLSQQKIMDTVQMAVDVSGQSFAAVQNLYNLEFSGLTAALPDSVQVLTLEFWRDDQFLIRLENISADTTTTVNLTNMFIPFKIISGRETNLAANGYLEESSRLQWQKIGANDAQMEHSRSKAIDLSAVKLDPKQIRTFVVKYQ